MIAVAVGYRRGEYPHFLTDSAQAIKWVKENIASLGGDVSNVFLSGHSAGGHIASLLNVRHEHFLAPLGIELNFIKGLILVSGVYSLFSPLSKRLLDVKNKAFVLLYVLPSFGSDPQLRREASPLILLAPDDTDTTLLGSVAMAVHKAVGCTAEEQGRKENRRVAEGCFVNTAHLPPTLIFNATFDMGLEADGIRMAKAMAKFTEVEYKVIEGSDHGSVCRSQQTNSEIARFVNKIWKGP